MATDVGEWLLCSHHRSRWLSCRWFCGVVLRVVESGCWMLPVHLPKGGAHLHSACLPALEACSHRVLPAYLPAWPACFHSCQAQFVRTSLASCAACPWADLRLLSCLTGVCLPAWLLCLLKTACLSACLPVRLQCVVTVLNWSRATACLPGLPSCLPAAPQALIASDPGQLRSLSKGESHYGSFNRHFPVARCSSKTQEVHQVRRRRGACCAAYDRRSGFIVGLQSTAVG
jgi:hypothetical protein